MVEKKSEKADALGAILAKLEAMEGRLDNMEAKSFEPPKLRLAEERGNPYKDQRVVEDAMFKDAPSLLNEGDIVRLKADTEKAITIMQNISMLREEIQRSIQDKGILGTVVDYKFTNHRTADPKFRINFHGIGTDGIHMSEMEVIERV